MSQTKKSTLELPRRESSASNLSRARGKQSNLFRGAEKLSPFEIDSEREFNKNSRLARKAKSKRTSGAESASKKGSIDGSTGSFTMPRSRQVRGSRVARKCTSLFEINGSKSAEEFFDEKGQAKARSDKDNKSPRLKNTIKKNKKQSSSFSLGLSSKRKPKGPAVKAAGRKVGSYREVSGSSRPRGSMINQKRRLKKKNSFKKGMSLLVEKGGHKSERKEGKDSQKNLPTVKRPPRGKLVKESDADADLVAYASTSMVFQVEPEKINEKTLDPAEKEI